MKWIISLTFIAIISACGSNAQSESNPSVTDITKQELPALITSGAVLLDVRTPEEVAEGTIDGALTINFYDDDFAEQLNSIPKDASVVVYCKSGGRSAKASKLMVESGWTDVYNLLGGYDDYSE